MYKFKIYESLSSECEKTWRELEEKSHLNYFQSFDYIREVVNQEEIKKIKIVVIYSENQVTAIFPLEIKNYYIFRVLQWIGTQKSDLCNPIIHKNISINNKFLFLNTWREILNEIGKFDLIFFNNQPSLIEELDNPFVKFFNTKNFSKIYQILLPDNYDIYKKDIKQKDKKHFYEIHRTSIKLSNLEKDYTLDFEVTNLNDGKYEFNYLIKNKLSQLKTRNIKNKFSQEFMKIYENLMMKRDNKFLILNFKINGKIISNCFGIIYRNTFYYYIPMIGSNDYNNFKPGKILILKIIQWCISKKIKIFDFGLGEEKYKKHFSNKDISLHKYLKYQSLKGLCLYILLKIFFFKKLS